MPLWLLLAQKQKLRRLQVYYQKKIKNILNNWEKKIKPDSDTIEIGVSNLYSSKTNPNVQCYDVTKTIGKEGNNSSSSQSSTISVPYIKNGVCQEKNSPKNYLEKLFSRWLKDG